MVVLGITEITPHIEIVETPKVIVVAEMLNAIVCLASLLNLTGRNSEMCGQSKCRWITQT